jgi:excinuclease UvrABC nuclease subunit
MLRVAEDEVTYNALELISQLQEEMREAAGKLEFERAAHLRDQIEELQQREIQRLAKTSDKKKVDYRNLE